MARTSQLKLDVCRYRVLTTGAMTTASRTSSETMDRVSTVAEISLETESRGTGAEDETGAAMVTAERRPTKNPTARPTNTPKTKVSRTECDDVARIAYWTSRIAQVGGNSIDRLETEFDDGSAYWTGRIVQNGNETDVLATVSDGAYWADPMVQTGNREAEGRWTGVEVTMGVEAPRTGVEVAVIEATTTTGEARPTGRGEAGPTKAGETEAGPMRREGAGPTRREEAKRGEARRDEAAKSSATEEAAKSSTTYRLVWMTATSHGRTSMLCCCCLSSRVVQEVCE